MDRAEQFEVLAKEYLKKRFDENLKEIKEEYQINRHEIQKIFRRKIKQGLEECESREKIVCYIVISVLESSFYTRSYELQIAFFDKNFYLDENPVYRYWTPDFIFREVEEDMRLFKKEASKEIIRVQEYELADIQKKYLINHYYLVCLLIQGIIENVMEEAYRHFGCLDSDTRVTFGKYMERPMQLYPEEV